MGQLIESLFGSRMSLMGNSPMLGDAQSTGIYRGSNGDTLTQSPEDIWRGFAHTADFSHLYGPHNIKTNLGNYSSADSLLNDLFSRIGMSGR